MNGQLDVPFLGMLEQKNEKSRFVRVDSDVLDRLIVKEDVKPVRTHASRDGTRGGHYPILLADSHA